MKYCSLEELKEELDVRDIKYKEEINGDGVFIYVDERMQVQKHVDTPRKKFYPQVRVSLRWGDNGYYIRDCGVIYEDMSLEDTIDIIESIL